MSAAEIAKALSGHPNGSGGWLCRCPLPGHGQGHGDRRPSLSVADGERRTVIHCFAGCEPRDILDHLRRAALIDGSDNKSAVAASPFIRPSHVHHPDQVALGEWLRGRNVAHTVVETYLRGRGCTIAIPPTIKMGSILYRGHSPLPTMLAAVQAPDGPIIAIQRTVLTCEGAKAPIKVPRLTTGILGAGAVRLAPASDVLGLAEGVETGLAAMEVARVPVWAVLGCNRLSRIDVPPIVREIHIFGDNDAPGRKAADRAAERFHREGLTVRIRYPSDEFGDWNDALVANQVAS